MSGSHPPRPALLAAALGLSLSCAPFAPARAQDDPAPRSYPDGVVALVEGTPITRYELELFCRLTKPSEYLQLPLESSAAQRIRHAVLTDLIKQRVLTLRAEQDALKLTEDDERRLEFDLQRKAEPYGGIEGLRHALDAIAIPYEYYVDRQRATLLVNKLLVKNISHDIFVTPTELRKHYEQHLNRFERPGETRFRQIVLYRSPDDAVRVPEAVQKRLEAGTWDPAAFAEELRKRALAGEHFEKLAVEASMGIKHDTEWVVESPHTLVPPLDGLVRELGVGEVSEARPDGRGAIYLVQLVDRRERGVLAFEEVQEEIEAQLKEEIWARRVDDWIGEVVSEADIHRFLPEQ